jgi:hypothetical protein
MSRTVSAGTLDALCEFIAYERDLTPDEVARTEGYLRQRFGEEVPIEWDAPWHGGVVRSLERFGAELAKGSEP